MYKITRESVSAFINHESYTKGNSLVTTSRMENLIFRFVNPKILSRLGDVSIRRNSYYYLHYNRIARLKNHEFLEINDAGWCTKTTKDRLNGILEMLEVPMRLSIRNGGWIMNDLDTGLKHRWGGRLFVIEYPFNQAFHNQFTSEENLPF